MPGFEVYLQFDSLRERPLRVLRGVDLREVRSKALERLNAITHPLVREWSAARLAEAAEKGVGVVVQDIPLLFENNLDGLFKATILVYVPPELQLERLVARGLPEADARARIANQLPIDAKRGRATYVIDNSGSREETRAQTEKVWAEITASG